MMSPAISHIFFSPTWSESFQMEPPQCLCSCFYICFPSGFFFFLTTSGFLGHPLKLSASGKDRDSIKQSRSLIICKALQVWKGKPQPIHCYGVALHLEEMNVSVALYRRQEYKRSTNMLQKHRVGNKFWQGMRESLREEVVYGLEFNGRNIYLSHS